jgi:glycosyltransferase 2 family protein
MKKGLLSILQYLFFAALAAFFVWLSLRGLDQKHWVELKAALDRANYWLLVPVLLLLLASHLLRALRWKQLIEPLGYKPSILNTFFGVIIGYFVNLGAPRLGEVVKCTILSRYEKVPVDKLVGTIVAERAFDVLCLVIIFALTLIFQFDVIHSLFAWDIFAFFRNAGGRISWLKIGIAVFVALMALVIVKGLLNRYGHINIVQKIKGVFLNIWHGLISVRSLKNKPLFFMYSAGIWLLYLLSTWVGFFAIKETSGLSLTDALSVLAMGSIGMIVSPGGIGAYALLVEKTVAFYNVPNLPYGQALGWLLWFGQFLSFILFGVASFILLPRINRRRVLTVPIVVNHESTADHPA